MSYINVWEESMNLILPVVSRFYVMAGLSPVNNAGVLTKAGKALLLFLKVYGSITCDLVCSWYSVQLDMPPIAVCLMIAASTCPPVTSRRMVFPCKVINQLKKIP